MSLITAWMCNFLQSKSHVVCACTFFLSLPDKSKNDQDSDSDWFTIYCIDIWLLTWLLIFEWVMLWKWQHIFINPILEFFFVFFQLPNLFVTQNVVYPTLISLIMIEFNLVHRVGHNLADYSFINLTRHIGRLSHWAPALSFCWLHRIFFKLSK
jgi:hypothetical protein